MPISLNTKISSDHALFGIIHSYVLCIHRIYCLPDGLQKHLFVLCILNCKKIPLLLLLVVVVVVVVVAVVVVVVVVLRNNSINNVFIA
jgi:hypothetical protein